MLYIAESPKRGRGVFTDSRIAENAVIERCPVIEIPETEKARIDRTVIFDFYYGWGGPRGPIALPLGYGAIYNHSSSPNARSVRRLEDRVLEFVALREIAPHEEILVNYVSEEGCPELWGRERIDWVD